MSVTEFGPSITVDVDQHDGASVLTVSGVLDGRTYRLLRDSVIKAALDEPRAVIVDVDFLSVPFESAWAVFTSARWHVSTWPDVPVFLVCRESERQRAVARSGVTRYVPLYPTLQAALVDAAHRSLAGRRRARTQLPTGEVSTRLSRALIAQWLTGWAQSDLIPVAGTVATVFIENVLVHTHSAPTLIVESYRDTVTVAVEDRSQLPAIRLEGSDSGTEILSGLAIVSALCRAWGSTPTSSGKTVWALVGRENQL